MNQRLEESYGPFRIIAGVVNKSPQAIAYLGSRVAYRTEAESPETAAETLRKVLEANRAKHVAQRVDGVPVAAEYRDALASLLPRIDPVVLHQLRHHLRFGPATTMETLGKVTGQLEEEAERHYVRLGRLLSRVLDFSPDTQGSGKQARPIFAFATQTEAPEGSARGWRLRREAAEGFAALLAESS